MIGRAALPAICAATFALAQPALAQETPADAMIDAAIATGDPEKVATVVEIAKAAYPQAVDAIDARYSAYQSTLAAEKAEALEAQEEAIRSAGLFENWSGSGELGAFRSTGNSSNLGLTAGLSLVREGIDWRHTLRVIADYQETDGAVTREQILAAYEPNFRLNDRLFLYGLAQYERDRFQGFSSRYSASGGLGYQVIDTDSVGLSIKGGPAWRRTEFADGSNSSDLAGLAALDFDWQIAERLKLTEDASAFIQSGNTTIVSATGLEAALGEGLSARLAYVVEHDTDPPVGAVQTDTLTRFTLIYGF